MLILSRTVCISDVSIEKCLFLKLVQGPPRVIRATNLTPQNGKELFQLTQCSSPVWSCLLIMLTYTTLQQEYMLCIFISRKWLGEGKKRRRRRGIFQFWNRLPFTLASKPVLPFEVAILTVILHMESGIWDSVGK